MDVPVEDRLAINDLLMKYVWASDTGDVDAFVDTFLPDGLIGRPSGERYDRATKAFADLPKLRSRRPATAAACIFSRRFRSNRRRRGIACFRSGKSCR